MAVDVFNTLAKTYQYRFMNVNLYKDSFDFLEKELAKNNFQILYLDRKEYFLKEEKTTDLIIIASIDC